MTIECPLLPMLQTFAGLSSHRGQVLPPAFKPHHVVAFLLRSSTQPPLIGSHMTDSQRAWRWMTRRDDGWYNMQNAKCMRTASGIDKGAARHAAEENRPSWVCHK
ncbi:hypothetical protein AG1IA_07553 [Rhizoctonia solani AG-1 IA]|uniref:Uncharacterized protein n=1 Tax=Thanatephorus cucumeris (strain AG1-IA) TaxID=983506 RepID=L8WNS8_THACA|nr:hypothetical protein AG1IA_07553 [Rhizoctonia solani AG-1 IA]